MVTHNKDLIRIQLVEGDDDGAHDAPKWVGYDCAGILYQLGIAVEEVEGSGEEAYQPSVLQVPMRGGGLDVDERKEKEKEEESGEGTASSKAAAMNEPCM